MPTDRDVVIPVRCGAKILISAAKIEALLPKKSQAEYALVCIGDWVALLDDGVPHSASSPKPLKVFAQFLSRIYRMGLKAIAKEYAELSHQIVKQCLTTDLGSTTGPFLSQMSATPVFREYLHWYRTRDSRYLSYVFSFLIFIKKLDLDDESLETTALRGWLTVEEHLSNLVLPDLTHLRQIICDLLPKPNFDDLLPKHGPGVTADAKSKRLNDKRRSMNVDPRMQRFLNYKLGRNMGIYVASEDKPQSESRILESEFRFVPKDQFKYRSIGMEPTTRMLAQQLINSALKDSLQMSSGKHWIRFDDQTWNQKLSELGSRTNEIDTTDLSNASDSVAWELVRGVFPYWVLPSFAATRSTVAKMPDGSKVRLKKFAPMGSAICFPVESILFLGIIYQAAYERDLENGMRYSIHDVSKRFSKTLEDHYEEKYAPIGVYGDDLCTDSRLTQRVLDLLRSYGFTVNTEKSFLGDQAFRESCGEFYCWGERLAIVRISMWGFDNVTPEAYESMIGFLNRLGDLGYYRTRSYMINLLTRRFGFRPWFTSREGTPGIYSKDPKVSRLPKRRVRVNPDLQRKEVRVQTVVRRRPYGPVENNELYGYLCWSRAGSRGWGRVQDGYLYLPPTDYPTEFYRDDVSTAQFGWSWKPVD